MSDFQAFGAVSATLRDLLLDRMELPSDVGRSMFDVTVGYPRSDSTGATLESSRVNLFLYRVTENGALKNQHLPEEGRGDAYEHPPLALDLHYLLTAYGTTEETTGFPNDVRAQTLLGSAMRVLHDCSIITERISTISEAVPRPILHPALQDAREHVRLSLEPLSIEDLSKVWTALTMPFRLGASYHVSVVQIQSRRPRHFPQLVGEPPQRVPADFGTPPSTGPRVFAAVLRVPFVSEISTRAGAIERRTPFVRVGDIVVLRGLNFGNRPARVFIAEVEVQVTPTSDDRLEFVLPDDPALQPGVQTLQLAVTFGDVVPLTARSNAAAFMLVPRASGVALANTPVPRRVTVTGTRLMRSGHSGETLIGRHIVDARDYLTGSTPTQLLVPVPDRVCVKASAVLSSSLSPMPALTVAPFQIDVQIAGGAVVQVELAAAPTTVPDAALLLQTALRNPLTGAATFTPVERTAYEGARVAVIGDRVAVLAGGFVSAFTFTDHGGDTTASTLGLTSGTRNMYVSGELDPFPRLTSAAPAFQVSEGGNPPATAVLPAVPRTVEETATHLATALAAVGPLAGTVTGALGRQILILPPVTAGPLTFSAAAADPTTVVELQLDARYSVRVRVDGAEAIDRLDIELPK
jgi:hypothetical protein